MRSFHLSVARIGESLFDGEVVSVSVPGSEGKLEVLAGHEPFVSELKSGTVHATLEDGEKQDFAIPARGIIEVSHEQATILL